MDRSERLQIAQNVNAPRVAVRSIAWLDDLALSMIDPQAGTKHFGCLQIPSLPNIIHRVWRLLTISCRILQQGGGSVVADRAQLADPAM